MANSGDSYLDKLIPKGSAVDSIVIKAKETADVRSARLRQERWSFFVKDLGPYFVSYLFVILIGGYSCLLVARHGVNSPEARVAFPLITTLFGGVLGIIVGKNAK